jgi:hypothetical protein
MGCPCPGGGVAAEPEIGSARPAARRPGGVGRQQSRETVWAPVDLAGLFGYEPRRQGADAAEREKDVRVLDGSA